MRVKDITNLLKLTAIVEFTDYEGKNRTLELCRHIPDEILNEHVFSFSIFEGIVKITIEAGFLEGYLETHKRYSIAGKYDYLCKKIEEGYDILLYCTDKSKAKRINSKGELSSIIYITGKIESEEINYKLKSIIYKLEDYND